jgi:hypothetical protein
MLQVAIRAIVARTVAAMMQRSQRFGWRLSNGLLCSSWSGIRETAEGGIAAIDQMAVEREERKNRTE